MGKKSKRFFNTVNRLGGILSKAITQIIILLTALMVLTVLLGVFYRYVLRSPLGWTEELARFLMIWAALLAISVCIYQKEHVSIQIIMQLLPIRVAQFITFLVNILIAIFLCVLTYKGMEMVLNARVQYSFALRISMFWPLMSVPVSGALALIQHLIQMILSFDPDITLTDLLGETEVQEALREVEEIQTGGESI